MASDGLERDLAKEAVGFMSKEDYKRKREKLEEDAAVAAFRKANPEEEKDGEKDKKKKKDKKRPTGALSFESELEAEGEPSPRVAPMRMAKCQNVDTAGLKKNEREEQEEAAKQELKMREYLLEQRRAKEEPVTLSYCFRSAATQRELPNAVHKGTVVVKRGFTAEEIAQVVHRDTHTLGEKFLPKSIAGIREVLRCHMPPVSRD